MLNVLVAELREQDEAHPHGGSVKDKRNRDRVLRTSALKTLVKDLSDENLKNLTVASRIENCESESRKFKAESLSDVGVARLDPRSIYNPESEQPGQQGACLLTSKPLSQPASNHSSLFINLLRTTNPTNHPTINPTKNPTKNKDRTYQIT